MAGSDAPSSELGWRGAEKYVATGPQIYDLWMDLQERTDIFMNGQTEIIWEGGFRDALEVLQTPVGS